MLMDCLPGNVGMNLSDDMKVPAQHKTHFYAALAKIQVSLSQQAFA